MSSCLLWFHGFWQTFEAAGCVQSVMSQPQKQDCHTLQRVDLARPFLVSPAIKIEIESSLEMALSKAKSGGAWQSRLWQCGTLRPARNTKLFTYITQVKQSWVLFELLAVRRWSRLWEASAAMTSCVSRSFDFCAMTNRYLFRDRTPFTVTTIAMARGGLSWELNGVLSPHSRTASASDGTCLGS